MVLTNRLLGCFTFACCNAGDDRNYYNNLRVI